MTHDPAPPVELESLEEVARRLARAIREAEAVPAEERPRVLVFVAGGRRLALPLRALREVVTVPGQLSLVPRAPAALLGIMNLRGRVVLVADLVQVLPPELAPLAPPPGGEQQRVLLLEQGGREVGLLVDAVEGIAATGPDQTGETAVLSPESLLRSIAVLAD